MSVRLIASSRQKFTGEYINADDIKRASLCTDLEAAIKAEQLRETRFFRWENRFLELCRYCEARLHFRVAV